MPLTWTSVSARTGRIIADLPGLEVSDISQIIGSYTTTTASLPLPTAPGNWLEATAKGAACLVLLDVADDGSSVPLWGGMVTRRVRSMGDAVEMTLVSIEGYFDRRYVGTVTCSGWGQNGIVSSLLTAHVVDGATPGIPLRIVTLDGAGTARDRAYLDTDDKTVLSALTELMGVQGGPEWTVAWEWQHDPERLTPVAFVGSRIGAPPAAGMAPAATFEAPGAVLAAELVEDFSARRGATDVMAVSTAQGDVRPQSPRQASDDGQRPTFEHRFTPSTSISHIPTLTAHAQRKLAAMLNGSAALSLAAAWSRAPRLGRDWYIGDDIGYQIGGRVSGRETVPAFPGGMSGAGRALGWQMSLNEPMTIAPLLLTDGES